MNLRIYLTILFGSLLVVFALLLSFLPDPGQAAPLAATENPGTTSLISRHTNGTLGNKTSSSPSISADGRYVAFQSLSSNLSGEELPPEAAGIPNIFVRDTLSDQTYLISRHTNGTLGDWVSLSPSVSGNGQLVAFESWATTLIDNDANQHSGDVFVHNLQTGETRLISRHTSGPQGDSWSGRPVISADGRFVAFTSAATNLVDNDINGSWDVFVHDLQTGETSLISRHTNGSQGNGNSGLAHMTNTSISADGQFVAFSSSASNLVDDDGNGSTDVFVHDLQTGETSLISRHTNGSQGNDNAANPSISADGQIVVFGSSATNLVNDDANGSGVDLFVHNRQDGQTTLVSRHLNGTQWGASFGHVSISADARLLAFQSDNPYFVEQDVNKEWDVFVHDRLTGSTTLVSRHTDGTQGNGYSGAPSMSADGQFVAFDSQATNLVDDDTNETQDVFVHEFSPQPVFAISGRITDRNGSPIADVTVSSEPGQETLTESGGTFELRLTPGVHTVTVVKTGYSFTPASQTIELTQDTALGDFIGIADGGPVAPFLDLPFSYDGTLESFDRLMKNHSDEGQINSWFDHHYPKVWSQDGLWLYFDSITDRPTAQTFDGFTIWGYRDNWWYSGHDALDIERAGLPDWYARSAAAGTVKVSGNVPSCNLGICVVIDHGNGYFTVYGHLAGVSVSVGEVVASGQEIGTIGCTGICSAPHLHFAVYRDSIASPGWNSFADEKVVDPFGWSFEQPDPWVKDKGGPVSTYLWLHDIRPSDISFDGAAGAELSDASQRVQVVVPAKYFAGQLSASLFPATVDRILMSLRPAGYSFRVKLLGQDVEEPNPLRAQIGPDAQTSGQIDISIDYSQSRLAHLDTSKLTLYRHDEESSNWLPLSTSVDTSQKLVQAETDILGIFSLQAPLLCPSDTAEPDDVMFTAPLVDLGTEHFRVFDSLGDEDWFRWDTAAAQSIVVQTAELGTGVRTIIEVYDTGEALLATSESESAGIGAQFNWQAPDAGTYYIRLTPSATSSVGCAAEYKLTVQEQAKNEFSIYLPSVTGGD